MTVAATMARGKETFATQGGLFAASIRAIRIDLHDLVQQPAIHQRLHTKHSTWITCACPSSASTKPQD